MNVLPQVLFYLQMFPIFLSLNSMLIDFVWRTNRPRIAMRAGGLGIPDIRKFYRAIVLQRILNWRLYTCTRLWVSLEKCMAGRDQDFAPWLAKEHRGLSDMTSPLTRQGLG